MRPSLGIFLCSLIFASTHLLYAQDISQKATEEKTSVSPVSTVPTKKAKFKSKLTLNLEPLQSELQTLGDQKRPLGITLMPLDLTCFEEDDDPKVELGIRWPGTTIPETDQCYSYVLLPEEQGTIILLPNMASDSDLESCGPEGRSSCLGKGAFGAVSFGIFIDSKGIVHAVANKFINGRKLATHIKGDNDSKKGKYLQKAVRFIENEIHYQHMFSKEPEFLKSFGGGISSTGDSVMTLNFEAHISTELATPLNHPDLLGLFKKDEGANNGLKLQYVKTVAFALLKALESMEKSGIIHRDIKPDNIFVGANGQVKLGDFGLAIKSDEIEIGSIQGTQAYLPNIFSEVKQTHLTDVFSLGVTLYKLYYGKMPDISKYSGHPDSIFPAEPMTDEIDEFKEFLKSMLSENSADRSSAKTLLGSSFLKNAPGVLDKEMIPQPLSMADVPRDIAKRLKETLACMKANGRSYPEEFILRQLPRP